ncbi:MAG: hypothetical protein IPN46_19705 [Saprospiraceae bacterium]|nr:hypothetical protein [Saprospiraceae bacterium]
MNNIKLFENKKVRSHYDTDKEIWYFSIVDIVGILTDQPTVERARNYWKVLKSRLSKAKRNGYRLYAVEIKSRRW